jgi:hypothetical protein
LKVEISDINIASTFTEWGNLEGSFTVDNTNTDWITEVSYKIVSEDWSILYSKELDITNDWKYNISYNMSGLGLWNYKVEITAKDNGNTEDSVDTKISEFEIVAPKETINIYEIWDKQVNDDWGTKEKKVWEVTWEWIQEWAEYTIVNDPTYRWLRIDENWKMTWKWEEFDDRTYEITIKVTNPDWTSDTESFTLTVIDTL